MQSLEKVNAIEAEEIFDFLRLATKNNDKQSQEWMSSGTTYKKTPSRTSDTNRINCKAISPEVGFMDSLL